MRNVLKKAAAVVLSAAMCLSFAGCYNENNTWSAKKGEDTLPIGGYIYYLYSAYSEAASKVSSEEEVLKATIEEKNAETWIQDKAMEYLKAYYFIADKFDQLGLEITAEEQSAISSNTDSMWPYYKDRFEAMGIAKESFHQASSLYNLKYQKVMEAMYGEEGEMEIPEDEFKTYFTENYYSYEYFYASLTKSDDDGNSVDMTDEEKEETKSKLEDYVDQINKKSASMEELASAYAEDALGNASNSTYSAPSPAKSDAINSTIKKALDELEDNKASLAETDTTYYVIRKLPIADKFDETLADETQKLSLISSMKGEEFSDYVLEQGKAVEGVELNQAAMDTVKLSKLVTDSNKKGTSSASSEASGTESGAGENASSSAESSASSETSSAAE